MQKKRILILKTMYEKIIPSQIWSSDFCLVGLSFCFAVLDWSKASRPMLKTHFYHFHLQPLTTPLNTGLDGGNWMKLTFHKLPHRLYKHWPLKLFKEIKIWRPCKVRKIRINHYKIKTYLEYPNKSYIDRKTREVFHPQPPFYF